MNTLIRNALVFDGTGQSARTEDIALRDGRVAARGANLPAQPGDEIIDASGLWLTPGLLDIHTHLDLEMELDPGMPEVVRHGTTTVVVGNCSLGTAFGAQRRNGDDPIVDCFTRVENIPKPVLRQVVDKLDWHDTAGYMQHLDALPLGPNVATLIPHSMLRIEVMGTEAAVTREPTSAERARMVELLQTAMDQGFVGLSTDSIPFHYLSNDPRTEKRIPANYASFSELRQLLAVVRKADRVWQCTPDVSHRIATMLRYFLSCGTLFGKALKTSALAAVDLTHERNTWKIFPAVTRIINSSLLQGRMHFQLLTTPFRMFAEGAINPIFEEFVATRALMACEIERTDERQRRMNDPQFAADFVREWNDPKSVATFNRDLDAMRVQRCPVDVWQGETFGAIYRRLRAYQSAAAQTKTQHTRSESEAAELAQCPPLNSEAEFLVHLFRRFDRDLRWWFTVSNDRPEIVKKLLYHPHMLPGFNDSGAHLINLAFFDGNLVTLQLAQQDSLDHVAQAVRRLTREPAEFFGLDAGRIDIGAQADVVLIDPEALRRHDADACRVMVHSPTLGEPQLVNRPQGVVQRVFIAGETVWADDTRAPALGARKLGHALRAGRVCATAQRAA
jgi:N-acyl-D-aspartate/D-glutamate deacylase